MQHFFKFCCEYGLTNFGDWLILRLSQKRNERSDTMNANLLRAKFKECGKTQAEVAELIGMSTNSLSRKLSGKRDFRLSEVDRICQVLGIENPAPIFLSTSSQTCNGIQAS